VVNNFNCQRQYNPPGQSNQQVNAKAHKPLTPQDPIFHGSNRPNIFNRINKFSNIELKVSHYIYEAWEACFQVVQCKQEIFAVMHTTARHTGFTIGTLATATGW